MILVKL